MSRGRGLTSAESTVRPTLASAINTRQLAHVYNYDDEITGLKARVESIQETDPEVVLVSGYFYHDNKIVGMFKRNLHKDRSRVVNFTMRIEDEALRKRGFNTRWAQRCEEYYRQQGFEEIVLDATRASINTWMNKGYGPLVPGPEEESNLIHERIQLASDLHESGRGDEIAGLLTGGFSMSKKL